MLRRMSIPILVAGLKRVTKQLKDKGFRDGEGNSLTCFRYLKLSQSEANKQIYFILRGLSNWWSIAGNRKAALSYVSYILRYSLAKMYAAKFKLNTVAQVFRLGKNNLSKPVSKKKKSVVGVTD